MFHAKTFSKALHGFAVSISSNTELDVVVVFGIKYPFSLLDTLASKGPIETSKVVLIRAIVSLSLDRAHLARSSFRIPAISATIRTVV